MRYAQVADVLRAADPDRPEDVSMRAFDATRDVAGHGSLPSAKSLAGWLHMPWQEVKEVALDDTRDQLRTYASRRRAAARPWLDSDSAAVAVKRVAEALSQDDLTATRYDVFRKSAPAATRGILPTSAQIVKLFGSWDTALAHAGLSSADVKQRTGLPVLHAIALFVRTQRRLPSRTDLEAFAKDPRWAFSLGRISGKHWGEWIAEFERWWVDELKREMPTPSGDRAFIPLSEEDIANLPGLVRAPKGWWTRNSVIDCVIAYLAAHPDVQSIGQRSYREWAGERSLKGIRTAAPSTLTKFGTLEELEREARRQMNRRQAEG